MATSAVSGRVLDADGSPVSGASVAVVDGDGAHRDIAALTTEDGAFRLGGVPPGRVVLQARKGGTSGRIDVDVGDTGSAPVDIRLG